MKSINAAKFKEQCLQILDHVGPEGIVITKHGKAVAKLVPIQSDCSSLIGSLKDKIRITDGDLFSTGIKWNAES